MDDHELEQMLANIGREEFEPSPDLVRRTQQRLRKGALLPWVLFGSLALQVVTGCGATLILFSDALGWAEKLCALAGASLLLGLFLLPLIAIRDQIACFFDESDPSLERC